MRFRVGLPEKKVGAGVGASGSRREPFLQNLAFRLGLPSQKEWEPRGSRVGACGIPTTKPKVLHKTSATNGQSLPNKRCLRRCSISWSQEERRGGLANGVTVAAGSAADLPRDCACSGTRVTPFRKGTKLPAHPTGRVGRGGAGSEVLAGGLRMPLGAIRFVENFGLAS